jgi:hypothetical protein
MNELLLLAAFVFPVAFVSLTTPAFAADASDAPTIAKDTVLVTVNNNEFNLKGEPADWTPTLAFKITGSLPDGSRVWAEFSTRRRRAG